MAHPGVCDVFRFTQGAAFTGQVSGWLGQAILIALWSDRHQLTKGHGKLCIAVFTGVFVAATWMVGRILDDKKLNFFGRLNDEHVKRNKILLEIEKQTKKTP